MSVALSGQSQRAASHVRELIRRRRLQGGDPLPSERELAEELRMGHVTVRRGLAALVAEGLIERQVGVGTFVANRGAGGPRSEAARTGLKNLALVAQASLLESARLGYCLAGVRQTFPQHEYRLEVLELPPERGRVELLRSLGGRGISGFLHQGYISSPELAIVRELKLPMVSLGVGDLPPEFPHVQVDYEELLGRLIHEAYRFGHQEVAMVCWQLPVSPQGDMTPIPQRRIEGAYQRVCRRYGLLSSADRLVMLDPMGIDGRHPLDVSPLMSLRPMPTCLVLGDEVMASAVFRELAAAGYQVPRDLSLMALIDCLPHSHPVPLTAPIGGIDFVERYAKAAQLLHRLIDGEAVEETHLRHVPQVQFKASLAPARALS